MNFTNKVKFYVFVMCKGYEHMLFCILKVRPTLMRLVLRYNNFKVNYLFSSLLFKVPKYILLFCKIFDVKYLQRFGSKTFVFLK